MCVLTLNYVLKSISGSVYFKVYQTVYRALAAVFPGFTSSEIESLAVRLL